MANGDLCRTGHATNGDLRRFCSATNGDLRYYTLLETRVMYGAVFIEEILPAVRSYPGRIVEFSGYDSKKSTIASVADVPERCTIAGW